MDPNDIRERVEELAKSAGLDLTSEHVAPNRCWLDGGTCPYGEPYGQFILRPEPFCRVPKGIGTGCQKLGNVSDQAAEFFNIDPDEPDLEEYFDANSVIFTSQLRAAADLYGMDSPEKLTLILAADILNDTNYDEHILLARDTPWNKKA